MTTLSLREWTWKNETQGDVEAVAGKSPAERTQLVFSSQPFVYTAALSIIFHAFGFVVWRNFRFGWVEKGIWRAWNQGRWGMRRPAQWKLVTLINRFSFRPKMKCLGPSIIVVILRKKRNKFVPFWLAWGSLFQLYCGIGQGTEGRSREIPRTAGWLGVSMSWWFPFLFKIYKKKYCCS